MGIAVRAELQTEVGGTFIRLEILEEDHRQGSYPYLPPLIPEAALVMDANNARQTAAKLLELAEAIEYKKAVST